MEVNFFEWQNLNKNALNISQCYFTKKSHYTSSYLTNKLTNFEFHKQTKATFTLESKNSRNIQEKNISISLNNPIIYIGCDVLSKC